MNQAEVGGPNVSDGQPQSVARRKYSDQALFRPNPQIVEGTSGLYTHNAFDVTKPDPKRVRPLPPLTKRKVKLDPEAVSIPTNFEHRVHIEDVYNNDNNFVLPDVAVDDTVREMFKMIDQNITGTSVLPIRRPEVPPKSTKPLLLTPLWDLKIGKKDKKNKKTVNNCNLPIKSDNSRNNVPVNSVFQSVNQARNQANIVPADEGYIMPRNFHQPLHEHQKSDEVAVTNNQYPESPTEVILLPRRKDYSDTLSLLADDDTPLPITELSQQYQEKSADFKSRAYENISQISDPSETQTFEFHGLQKPLSISTEGNEFEEKLDTKKMSNSPSQDDVDSVLKSFDAVLEEQHSVDSRCITPNGSNSVKNKRTNDACELGKSSVKELTEMLSKSLAEQSRFTRTRSNSTSKDPTTKLSDSESTLSNQIDEPENADCASNYIKGRELKLVNILGGQEKTIAEILAAKSLKKKPAPPPPPAARKPKLKQIDNLFQKTETLQAKKTHSYENVIVDDERRPLEKLESAIPEDTEVPIDETQVQIENSNRASNDVSVIKKKPEMVTQTIKADNVGDTFSLNDISSHNVYEKPPKESVEKNAPASLSPSEVSENNPSRISRPHDLFKRYNAKTDGNSFEQSITLDTEIPAPKKEKVSEKNKKSEKLKKKNSGEFKAELTSHKKSDKSKLKQKICDNDAVNQLNETKESKNENSQTSHAYVNVPQKVSPKDADIEKKRSHKRSAENNMLSKEAKKIEVKWRGDTISDTAQTSDTQDTARKQHKYDKTFSKEHQKTVKKKQKKATKSVNDADDQNQAEVESVTLESSHKHKSHKHHSHHRQTSERASDKEVSAEKSGTKIIAEVNNNNEINTDVKPAPPPRERQSIVQLPEKRAQKEADSVRHRAPRLKSTSPLERISERNELYATERSDKRSSVLQSQKMYPAPPVPPPRPSLQQRILQDDV